MKEAGNKNKKRRSPRQLRIPRMMLLLLAKRSPSSSRLKKLKLLRSPLSLSPPRLKLTQLTLPKLKLSRKSPAT